jgi:hypothetical protein
MSATSSAQSHGGARRADCRPQLLRPVPPDPNADAVNRLLASPVGARLLSRESGRSCTTSWSPSRQDGALATAECRRAPMGER